MKTLWVIIGALLFGMLIGFAEAEELPKGFDLSIKGTYSIYQDRDILEDGKGLKWEIRYDWAYIWGSWEATELRLTGQRSGSIDLYGFGPGIKIKLVDGLFIFGEIGYYIPRSELQKDTMTYFEGAYYHWMKICNDIGRPDLIPIYNQYKYEIKPSIGGTVGVEFKQKVWENWELNISLAYRFLNLKEDWDAYPLHPTGPADYIQTKEKRSFSGGMIGVGATYRF